MTRRDVLLYATGTGLVALAAGAYLVYLRGLPVLVLLGLGAFFVLFYTWPWNRSQSTKPPELHFRALLTEGGVERVELAKA